MLTTFLIVLLGVLLVTIMMVAFCTIIGVSVELTENWQRASKLKASAVVMISLIIMAACITGLSQILPKKECCPPVEIKQG